MAPSSTWSSLAAQSISDHEINLFYETDHGEGSLTFSRGPATRFGQLAVAVRDGTLKGMPERLMPALAERYADESLFAPCSDLKLGADFYDHIADLASGRRQDLVKIFSLNEIGRRFLRKGDLYPADAPPEKRMPHRLVLKLSKAATARLVRAGAMARTYRLAIEDVKVFVFRTRKGITQARVTVHPEIGGPFSPLELLEVQVALGRFNEIYWLAHGESVATDRSKTTLGTLIRAMVLGTHVSTREEGRVSTWTFMRFDDAVGADDRARMGHYFARHYTSDYILSDHPQGMKEVRDFETVTHAFALEGACTVVAPDGDDAQSITPFLVSFKENTFHRHYVPLKLLLLHEHGFLVDRTSRSVLTADAEKSADATLAKLGDLRRGSLVYRLMYHFLQVSYITMHNNVSLALREVLGLDNMLKQLSTDIAEVEGLFQSLVERRQELEERQRSENDRRRERRLHFTTVSGAAALVAIAVLQLCEGGFNAFGFDKVAEKYSFIAAAIVFAASCFVGFLRRPQNLSPVKKLNTFGTDDIGDFTVHATLEHMLDIDNR